MKILFIIMATLLFSCKSDINDLERVKDFKSNFTNEPFQKMRMNGEIYELNGIINPTGIVIGGYCELLYSISPNNSELEDIIKELSSDAIYNCKNNKCEDIFYPDFRKDDILDKYPVPNFNDSNSLYSKALDFENSDLFVFKTQKGNFFKRDAINDIVEHTNIKKLEIDKIGNGYSNGAFVDYSAKKIIFWVIIW